MKQIKLKIKNRFTGAIIFEYSSADNTLYKTIMEAIKDGADLNDADLRGANLRDADLRDAGLRGADLSGADTMRTKGIYSACPTEGIFVGWKKASGYIVKLEILADSRRSSSGGNKCRCDKAKVLEIQFIDGSKADIDEVASSYNANFIYKIGVIATEPLFEENRFIECAPGIHFFVDRKAAVEY